MTMELNQFTILISMTCMWGKKYLKNRPYDWFFGTLNMIIAAQ